MCLVCVQFIDSVVVIEVRGIGGWRLGWGLRGCRDIRGILGKISTTKFGGFIHCGSVEFNTGVWAVDAFDVLEECRRKFVCAMACVCTARVDVFSNECVLRKCGVPPYSLFMCVCVVLKCLGFDVCVNVCGVPCVCLCSMCCCVVVVGRADATSNRHCCLLVWVVFDLVVVAECCGWCRCVRLCTCMYACMHAIICARMCACTNSLRMHSCMPLSICLMHEGIHACMHVCMHVYTCVYACFKMYVFMCEFMCACICAYVFMYTRTLIQSCTQTPICMYTRVGKHVIAKFVVWCYWQCLTHCGFL